MKKVLYFLIGFIGVASITSCQKAFLEKPDTTGATNIESVFAVRVTAEQALAAAYREILNANLYDNHTISNGIITGITGESMPGPTWNTLALFVGSGFSPVGNTGNIQSVDTYFDNFSALRKSFLVYENIDRTADIDATEKGWVKGEMKALVAYRYMNMMMHYGGVPIVDKVLSAESEDLNIPRATLQQTLDYTIKTADEAIQALPNSWPDKYNGRFVKGAAMAIKAKALLFAARPLFNSATPYLSLGANNNLICLGNADQQRWDAVITASEDALTWTNANGYSILNTGGGVNIPNTNALQDYGTATSTPSNKEVLLAFKLNKGDEKFFRFYNKTSGNSEGYLAGENGVISNFLPFWYRNDGTNQSWPALGETRPYSDYFERVNAMEPRFKADNIAHGIDSWANPGNSLWSYRNAGNRVNGPGNGNYGSGAATPVKFYYMAGNRLWFEYPLFRVAELYLNLAEAYNETGNSAKALQNLNVVHNRAGLPSITETDQTKLRTIIQREWAIEFFAENHRYFDVRHWKLDVGNNISGGAMRGFQFNIAKNPDGSNKDSQNPANLLSYYDENVYTAFWNARMFLSPIPQTEIDKGVIIQNPGY